MPESIAFRNTRLGILLKSRFMIHYTITCNFTLKFLEEPLELQRSTQIILKLIFWPFMTFI